MKLKCLSCEALTRMVYLCAARSPHLIDVQLLRIGLHNKPLTLRERLQAQIDALVGEDYEAITLAYGLCGKATAGLVARDIPLVIPRAHDCVTLFLGDRMRYKEQFEEQPGTYWYARDYIERRDSSGVAVSLGAGLDDFDMDTVYDEYVEKYGVDNADYLMEVMGAWQSHYKRAAYIDTGVGHDPEVEEQARAEATRRGWAFEHLEGNLVLIQRLLAGDWENDFLVVEPGQKIVMSYDDGVIKCSGF